MPSPFPGMDPFIESSGLWEDFHDDLVSELKRALSSALPRHYVVRTADRAFVELVVADGTRLHPFKPDVSVLRQPPAPPWDSGGVAVMEPKTEEDTLSVRSYVSEEFREQFVEVLQVKDAGPRLVTCIEILSPSNKKAGSPGRDLYLRQRQALLTGEANLVELDLLRGGERMPMADPLPESPYFLLVGRKSRVPYCDVTKAWSLKPLPALVIPLANGDPDLRFELQPMVDGIYARARYDVDIAYGKPLVPALPADEAAFLKQRLDEFAAIP